MVRRGVEGEARNGVVVAGEVRVSTYQAIGGVVGIGNDLAIGVINTSHFSDEETVIVRKGLHRLLTITGHKDSSGDVDVADLTTTNWSGESITFSNRRPPTSVSSGIDKSTA